MPIGNFKSEADRLQKTQQYLSDIAKKNEFLNTQRANQSQAIENMQLDIAPPPQQRMTEDEYSATLSNERDKAIKNLRSFDFKEYDISVIIQSLEDANELVMFNDNYQPFKSFIEGRRLKNSTGFKSEWDRFKINLNAGDVGTQIAELKAELQSYINLFVNDAKDKALLSKSLTDSVTIGNRAIVDKIGGLILKSATANGQTRDTLNNIKRSIDLMKSALVNENKELRSEYKSASDVLGTQIDESIKNLESSIQNTVDGITRSRLPSEAVDKIYRLVMPLDPSTSNEASDLLSQGRLQTLREYVDSKEYKQDRENYYYRLYDEKKMTREEAKQMLSNLGKPVRGTTGWARETVLRKLATVLTEQNIPKVKEYLKSVDREVMTASDQKTLLEQARELESEMEKRLGSKNKPPQFSGSNSDYIVENLFTPLTTANDILYFLYSTSNIMGEVRSVARARNLPSEKGFAEVLRNGGVAGALVSAYIKLVRLTLASQKTFHSFFDIVQPIIHSEWKVKSDLEILASFNDYIATMGDVKIAPDDSSILEEAGNPASGIGKFTDILRSVGIVNAPSRIKRLEDAYMSRGSEQSGSQASAKTEPKQEQKGSGVYPSVQVRKNRAPIRGGSVKVPIYSDDKTSHGEIVSDRRLPPVIKFGSASVMPAMISLGILKIKQNGKTNWKKIALSTKLVKIIQRLVREGEILKDSVEELTKDEHNCLCNILKIAGLDQEYDIHSDETEIDKEIMDTYNAYNRFNVLRGEILAGNDNPQIVKEMRALILKLIGLGVLSKRNVTNMMLLLSSFS